MLAETVAVYRQRLMDISWFMRFLNEYIARKANAEDNCTGRFWEGRFKAQALLDEAALAACMAYVDLNPVRANMAQTPENSNHTSIQLRIKAAIHGKQPSNLQDYIQLVELTGRCIRENKRGYIDHNQQPILNRLNISPENWLILTTQFRKVFHGAVDNSQALTEFCQHQHLKK